MKNALAKPSLNCREMKMPILIKKLQNIPLIKILFEVVSAFGTVGLTMDLTSEYYNWTEFIIIIVMLCGKIGLLNISRALVPPKDPKNYRYTKGHIHL